jgi:sugar phosphate isomerase/epimerase
MTPPIPVALSTGSIYTYGTARAFELAARAGYDGVELIVDDRWDTRQASYLRRLVDHYGVSILSVHHPFTFQRCPGWPRAEVERVKLSLALAEEVGARTLNLHLPLRVRDLLILYAGRRWIAALPGATPDQRRFREWLTGGGLAALQAQTPVAITVENLPVRRLFGRRFNAYALNTWGELATFSRICLDTTHCGTTGSDLLAVYQRLAERVAHVHLSDYDGHNQHRPIGQGHLPLAPFLEALAARAYQGIVVVELDPSGLPMQDEDKVAAELRRNLELCRTHLRRGAGATAAEDGAVTAPAAGVAALTGSARAE